MKHYLKLATIIVLLTSSTVYAQNSVNVGGPANLTYALSTLQVALISAAIALALSLVVLRLVSTLNRDSPDPSKFNVIKILFLDTETDTYSLSKFQFYCWTVASLFGYSYLVISRMLVQGMRWPDVPSGLPGIIAFSAGTAVGAQFVTNVRGSKGSGNEEPSLGDLVTSGGVAAPERIQILVWTILGVGAFCFAALQHSPGTIQELDPIPTGMLYMMGLSSAGYLGGKIARKPGPVINEISITPGDGDAVVADSAAPPIAGPPNVSQVVGQAQAAANGFTIGLTGNAQTAVQSLWDATTAASKAKTIADIQAVVSTLTPLIAKAESAAKSAADEFAQPGSRPESGGAAQIAQRAAAALHDLATALKAALGGPAATPPGTPRFTRVLELRGSNLSSEALFEIDGIELPFRMLRPDADNRRLPEIIIREPDDPTLARMLQLSIDPAQLEASDFQRYKGWFGTSDPKKRRTFTLTNPDGQKSDISFTMPPTSA